MSVILKKQINIPEGLSNDIKKENLNINIDLNSNPRREDGETLEQTILQLCTEALEIRKSVRNKKKNFKVEIIGSVLSFEVTKK